MNREDEFEMYLHSLDSRRAENKRLLDENMRLRELLVRCQPQIEAGYGHGRIDRELILDLKKEMGDE